jgi:uncharacterized protein YbjQ (UPF0145 family)
MLKAFFTVFIALGGFLIIVSQVHARDDKLLLPITDVLNGPDAQKKLDGSIKFFFGSQPHPKIITNFQSDVTNLKTNAFNKTDQRACEWVFLSTLLSLEKRAKQLGANAVVNIISYYQKVPMSSDTQYECHAGALMAGVALKGDFVKIETP